MHSCANAPPGASELVNRNDATAPRRQFYSSGDVAAETGIYRVFHAEHRLSHEVTVLKGNLFPVCTKCSNQVVFELLRPVSCDVEFRVVLNALPVIEESDESQEPLAC